MPGRFLLDTHIVVALASPTSFDILPLKVRRILEDPDAQRLLSVTSEIEIAIKNRLGKLDLSREELAAICSNALIESYPLRRHHADALFDLPLHHNDPFDRLIISTALSDNIPVISCDKQFRRYKGLHIVW